MGDAKHYFRQRCHGDVTLTHKPGPKQEGSQQTKSSVKRDFDLGLRSQRE